MGKFLHIAVWREKSISAARKAIEELAQGDNPFYMKPEECKISLCPKGTMVQFNEDCVGYEQYVDFDHDTLASVFAYRLGQRVLMCNIYDGQFWSYLFHLGGMELDRFSTMPDYFPQQKNGKGKSWDGKVKMIASEFGCAESDVARYLRAWTPGNKGRKARETDSFTYGDPMQLFDFLECLGFALPQEEMSKTDENMMMIKEKTEGFFGKIRTGILSKFHEPHWDYVDKTEREEYADLPEEFLINTEPVQSVVIRDSNGMHTITKDDLTEEILVKNLKDVLAGNIPYLNLQFQLQGEGTFVKRLNKTIYSPFRSDLVIHHGKEGMACLFYAGDTRHCHLLIGDFEMYMDVPGDEVPQVQIGEASVPAYGVHKKPKALEKALLSLFRDVEKADRNLEDSKLWSTKYTAGESKYKELRHVWGLLED